MFKIFKIAIIFFVLFSILCCKTNKNKGNSYKNNDKPKNIKNHNDRKHDRKEGFSSSKYKQQMIDYLQEIVDIFNSVNTDNNLTQNQLNHYISFYKSLLNKALKSNKQICEKDIQSIANLANKLKKILWEKACLQKRSLTK